MPGFGGQFVEHLWKRGGQVLEGATAQKKLHAFRFVKVVCEVKVLHAALVRNFPAPLAEFGNFTHGPLQRFRIADKVLIGLVGMPEVPTQIEYVGFRFKCLRQPHQDRIVTLVEVPNADAGG